MHAAISLIALCIALFQSLAAASPGDLTPPAEPVTVRVPILMYHYISRNPRWPADPIRTGLSVLPRQLASQLMYLQRAGYTTITLDNFVAALHGEGSLPKQPVILTFDDGYEDFYTNAYPLLQQYNAQATIYIITEKIGAPGYMSLGQLRELAASPLITIGAHTRTHPMLATLKPAQSWDELAGSKIDLEQALGVPVHHLAYPAGNYSPLILQQARDIGFATAVTTQEGLLQRDDQLLTLRRVRVNGGADLADFIAGLLGKRQITPKPHAPVKAPINHMV
jgi:peptidoglycan/xylan/chitin deacetylase (PgdA/CDA1 family)